MIEDLKEIYDSLKNHPYINEITLENAISYYNIYRKIFEIIYGKLCDEYECDYYNKSYKIPQLAFLTIDSHDISLMFNQMVDGRFETLKEIHHSYMMELLEVLASLFDDNIKKEYINIWFDRRYKDGWKWDPILYKLIEIEPGIFKGVNCIRESQWDKVIEKYKNIIEENKKYNNNIVVNAYQKELNDMLNETNKYHLKLKDEEYLNYFYKNE